MVTYASLSSHFRLHRMTSFQRVSIINFCQHAYSPDALTEFCSTF